MYIASFDNLTPPNLNSEGVPPEYADKYAACLEEERNRLLDENRQLAALNRELSVRVDALHAVITKFVTSHQKGFTLWLLLKYLNSFYRG